MGKNRGPRCFKPKQYNKCPKEFDIGGGSEMVLSSQVLLIQQVYPEKSLLSELAEYVYYYL